MPCSNNRLAPIIVNEFMVTFSHPRLDSTKYLKVRTTSDKDGHRLILDFPDGQQRVHRFVNDSEIYRDTVRVQAELISSGWRAIPDMRHPHSPSRFMRSHQFPQTSAL